MSPGRMKKPPPSVRCAVYTRKSTDEGLDKDFNTLDAQREACEAYIASQKGEGWICLDDRYDDGGFSGGNLERPALTRLLADIEASKVDCIVVYKVDRLSRSLLDFARLVEVLDAHNVSFVSVTQPINTADSAGRLMLNVLLSFAQFERETIADRTRDKMSAARRKGKWTGGMPVLGYDIHPDGGRLVVNEGEAEQVREIFRMYVRYKSLRAVCEELDHRKWRTKAWTTRKGALRGGTAFTKSTLQRHLTNVTYTGKVNHRGQVYAGEHEAIISTRTFNRVQELIAENKRSCGAKGRNKYGFLLRGLVRCAACDSAMSPSTARKGSRVYRYYVCCSAQKKGYRTCPCPSISAQKLEDLIIDQIKAIGSDRALQRQVVKEARDVQAKQVAALTAERGRQETKLAQVREEIAGLLRALAKGDVDGRSISDRLGELDARAEGLKQKVGALGSELDALQSIAIDAHDLAEALSLFDPIWDVLYPAERARIIELLIERVDYHGETKTLGIEFAPAGVKLLSAEIRQGEEGAA